MANNKSAEKRVRGAKVKTLINTIRKSELKTSIKKFSEAVAKNDEKATELLKKSFNLIDKAVARNILHKNTGARRKSKLARMMNAAGLTK